MLRSRTNIIPRTLWRAYSAYGYLTVGTCAHSILKLFIRIFLGTIVIVNKIGFKRITESGAIHTEQMTATVKLFEKTHKVFRAAVRWPYVRRSPRSSSLPMHKYYHNTRACSLRYFIYQRESICIRIQRVGSHFICIVNSSYRICNNKRAILIPFGQCRIFGYLF